VKSIYRDDLRVREAQASDLATLTRLKAPGALHRDRLRDAQLPGFRYLVLELGDHVIGFACLVFARPASWSDAHDPSCLPQIVDVQVAPEQRGKGYGTFLIASLEQLAVQHGCRELYLAVDPLHNPRALALYQRLGYRKLQPEPHFTHWEFVDSGGNLHAGDDWTVDMVKEV
jgi:GNAT superfamily N-acetyltransferase